MKNNYITNSRYKTNKNVLSSQQIISLNNKTEKSLYDNPISDIEEKNFNGLEYKLDKNFQLNEVILEKIQNFENNQNYLVSSINTIIKDKYFEKINPIIIDENYNELKNFAEKKDITYKKNLSHDFKDKSIVNNLYNFNLR